MRPRPHRGIGGSLLRELPRLLAALLLAASPGHAQDQDADAFPDRCDNCLAAPNPFQHDLDGDGTGDVCDCDFDGDGVCGIGDFNLFLPDFTSGADSGAGTDMDGSGAVGIGDFNLFLPGFSAGLPGPAATPPAVVEGACDGAAPGCSDPLRPGACFGERVAVSLSGVARPWTRNVPALGCTADPSVLVDAGFAAATADLNNPTDAWMAAQSGGQDRCPNAAFATFPSDALCGPGLPCDPEHAGLPCGGPGLFGSPVLCGDAFTPRACELHDVCRNRCGYPDTDCDAQLARNLRATCEALEGDERTTCRALCLVFADLYASAMAGPGAPGAPSARDLDQEQRDCACCPEALVGAREPPPVCGNGACEPAESCHAASCPADCGTCPLGTDCLSDADCGQGVCTREGVCGLLGAGVPCALAGACASGSCDATGACAPVCGDGRCDGGETCQTCASDCGPCPAGASCDAPSACASGVCDAGLCTGLPDTAPCAAGAQCASGLCNLGACIPDPLLPGDACDAEVCAFSSCVGGTCRKPAGDACTTDADCRTGSCSGGRCAPVCGDGFCDGVEICGVSQPASCAADCGLCEADAACDADGDCATGHCVGDQCGVVVSTRGFGFCTDDFDCADDEFCEILPLTDYGRCAPANRDPDGSRCREDVQCQSGFCDDGLLPSECAPKEPDGAACGENAQCRSGYCDPPTQTCGPRPDLGPGSACTDSAQCDLGLVCNVGTCTAIESVPDGGACDFEGRQACETRQCLPGGTCRGRQQNGVPCFRDDICISGICTLGFCTGNSCGNGTCNAWEKCGVTSFLGTALPAGNVSPCEADCGLCDAGEVCNSDLDCTTGVCVTGFCKDGPQALGRLCDNGEDCFSGRCALDEIVPDDLPLLGRTPGVCIADCGNGQCDGVESCGDADGRFECRNDCGLCSAGVNCFHNADCQSGICNFGTCAPGQVGFGEFCSTDAACRSGSCVLGVCGASCGDGVCEGLEACGNADQAVGECASDCGACPNGTVCSAGSDCQSGICNFFQCHPGGLGFGGLCSTSAACRSGSCVAGVCAAVCGDAVCEGAELCGDANQAVGECFADCGRCPNGSLCSAGTDCQSGHCAAGICAACRIFGQSCSSNGQCCSGNCTSGPLGNTFCGL